MEMEDSTYSEDFVSAARALYVRSGYSIMDSGRESGEIDFRLVAPKSQCRVAVRVIPGKRVITKHEVNRIFSNLGKDESLHFITEGTFAADVSSLVEEGKAITLIDGPCVEKTFSAWPDLISRNRPTPHFQASSPPPRHIPALRPSPGKRQRPLILTIVGVVTAGFLILGLTVAAVAIPNIGRINEAAIDAKDRRNAQGLVSIFAAAKAAGLDFAAANEELLPTLASIREGKTVDEEGPSQGTFFGVPQLDSAELEAAARYLMLQGGLLHYVPDETARHSVVKISENKDNIQKHQKDDSTFSRKDLVGIEARREAVEIARFMNEAKNRRNTDYLKIAGEDRDVAIQLLMSSIRNFVSRNSPGDLPEFERKYSEDSELLYFAKQFLQVENGTLVAVEDPAAYEKAFHAFVMNNRKVPDR